MRFSCRFPLCSFFLFSRWVQCASELRRSHESNKHWNSMEYGVNLVPIMRLSKMTLLSLAVYLWLFSFATKSKCLVTCTRQIKRKDSLSGLEQSARLDSTWAQGARVAPNWYLCKSKKEKGQMNWPVEDKTRPLPLWPCLWSSIRDVFSPCNSIHFCLLVSFRWTNATWLPFASLLPELPLSKVTVLAIVQQKHLIGP